MARFLIGLILGVFIGALAVGYQPTLPDSMRVGLANVMTLIARGTERAAESINRAAGRVAERAEPASGQEAPREDTAAPVRNPVTH
jgi:hypothetical protein